MSVTTLILSLFILNENLQRFGEPLEVGDRANVVRYYLADRTLLLFCFKVTG